MVLYKEKATCHLSSQYIHAVLQGFLKKAGKTSQLYYIGQMAKCNLPKTVLPVLIAH